MIIIYAHPNREGHCGALLNGLVEHFNKNNNSYEIWDLYKMNFNPVLQPDEHYTSGKYEITPPNKKLQDRIKKEDKFVFIYPTWWNGPPAILKGFFDRIFTGRYAFKYVNGIPKGLLKGKAAVVTTTGAPRLIGFFLLQDISARTVAKYTLRFCGIKTKNFIIGNSNKLTEGQQKKINALVPNIASYLD